LINFKFNILLKEPLSEISKQNLACVFEASLGAIDFADLEHLDLFSIKA